MYELNRVRLFGVGPRGARYTDVTLDLSEVGATVGGQGALFGAPIRRPSPYSLLLLENGGGKSVLLKLLFSVVLPGKRNTVGGSAAVMEKFVVGDDAAHVVLEWMNVRTGDRVITGKSLQRRRSGSAADKLAEHWWSLRPHQDVEIDSLPFAVDGRRLRLDGFREALQEIDRLAPVTQLTWIGAEIRGWTDHLRDIGIEPDLFAIQRRMNADEGDAATAFKFKSSREFIEWLLKVVLDPQDPVSVAENFDSYARTVGDRRAMLLEKEFADGAVAALRPVGAAQERNQKARAAREAATTERLTLLRRVRAREKAETRKTARLQELTTAAAATATSRETDRDRARDVVNEIRLQTLVLEHTEAQHEKQQAADGRDGAEADLRAWDLARLIERRIVAAEKATRFAQQIVQAEQEARPALRARDEAAAELLRKLADEAAAARTKQNDLNAQETEWLDQALELDEERSEEMRAAERWRAEQKSINEQVTASKRQVEAAVQAGLLDAGQPVATAAVQAQQHAESTAANLERMAGSAKLAHAAVSSTSQQVQEAHHLLIAARGRRDDANRNLQTVIDRASPLTKDEVVQTALSTSTVDIDVLDTSIDALIDRLADDATMREQYLDGLRAEQRDDQRLLDALGNGGYLPARAEVEASLEVLHAASVVAHAGWRYLAESVAADERDDVITAYPQLVDGIIIVDPQAAETAQRALAAARLFPAAAVAVGTSTRLLTAVGADHDADDSPTSRDQFVIEPNPALFDPDAAEARREQLRETMGRRGAEIQECTTALEHLRAVRTDLIAWRRECPPGRLADMREDLDRCETALSEAATTDSSARSTAATAEAERDRIDGELAALRISERAAADRAGRLGRLAEAVAAVAQHRQRLPELEELINQADGNLKELKTRRDRAQQQARDAARAAENAGDRAERHLAEMREIVTSTGERAAQPLERPVSELRAAYQAAAAAYAAVEVGLDLRATADTAETEAARLRTDVDRHDARDIARAQQLLASPDGADEAGRQAAIARTQRDRDTFAAAVSAADIKAGALSSQVASATPADSRTWIQLPDDRRPSSVEHGKKLLITAAGEHRNAQQQYEEAAAHAERMKGETADTAEAARAFREALGRFAALIGDPPNDPDETTAEYDGTVDAARTATDRVQKALSEAMAEENESQGDVNRLVDQAVRHANQPKYETMTNVSRRAIVALDREQLATRATEFAIQLEQRLATLTTDLDQAGQHRKLIVERLAALALGALKTLRTASKLSKLPAGLGEWEGKEFLRIRFAEPDSALLAARVGEVVDDMSAIASTRTSSGSAPKRDGMALLLRSIEAAVPKGFTVDILKPDAVLRDERVPIENMNEVFSGGQELTAAIVLYCTMAALRANERGQMRNKHSGVLFLDNPIGKASAEYLLELQQGVAAALGVQLVYTTGLSDDRALAAFPLWVRMRNDADLRAGLKHIRVAEVVRRQLPDPFTDDDAHPAGTAPGTVTATRVFRRPA